MFVKSNQNRTQSRRRRLDCQIVLLSFSPKDMRTSAHTTYVGGRLMLEMLEKSGI